METIQKEKVKLTAKVVSQEALTDDICSMWIQADAIAKAAKPGQFISVYTKDKSKVLPRPISLCEIDKEQGRLRIVYRVVGAGTKEFSAYQAGDDIEIMGPLGNGFPLKEKKAFLIGGGIGIPPMLELAKNLNCEKQMVLGYRDVLFLNKEFEQYGKVYVATEDGSAGTKGNVIDAIKANATALGNYKLSFYDPCVECNGNNLALTATGTTLTEGRTIAVDPSVIPLGSRVFIEGYGVFIAEDTGGAIKGNKIDIAVSTHERANELGVQYANVYLLK